MVRRTLGKAKPEVKGRLVIDHPAYSVWWRYATKQPPRPKPVANLVVFIKPQEGKPVPRKRSFYFGWKGGDELAMTEDLLRLRREHPGLLENVLWRLEPLEERMVDRGGRRRRRVG